MIFDYNNIKMCFKNIYTDFFHSGQSQFLSYLLRRSTRKCQNTFSLFKINATHYDIFFLMHLNGIQIFLCAQRVLVPL